MSHGSSLKKVKETKSEEHLGDQNASSRTLKYRKSSPVSPDISRKDGSSGSTNSGNSSDDSRPRSGDYTDSKGQRRRHSPKVSLNLNSKSNPLNPQTALQDILPGGKTDYIKNSNNVKNSQEGAEGTSSPIPKKSRSPKTKTDLDEEFREKVKRMDYNTVYMMAQRTKGPQQYKYRKILQEMYEEKNK